jgi:glycosyltransferase involved in cell wall biosynthesis
MSVPSLSIVIPVHNEPHWISRVVQEAAAAQRRSPFADADVVIVDDGSDDETRRALESLDAPLPLRIIRHERNAGRFAARRTGLEAARGELVLLLDSRVSLDPDALSFVASQMRNGDLPAWNGHVEIETAGNPFARFWSVVSYAAFHEYLKDPRTTSFGLDEYDRFPKGTTCFLAPRDALLEAIREFRSHYPEHDTRHVNDDTVLLRSLAARQRINISPGFACVYRSRTSLGQFLAHAFHRGTVFFDGFARPGTRYLPVIVAFFPASAAFGVFVLRRPRLGLLAAGSAPLAAAAGAAALRRPWRDVVAFASLAPPFAAVFAAGIWRGAGIAFRSRMRS